MQQGTVGMDCKKLCFHFGKKYFVFLLYFKQEFMIYVPCFISNYTQLADCYMKLST